MINILGVYPVQGFKITDALLVSLIAILIVFLILGLIIAITFAIQKGMEKVETTTQINPRPENEILSKDEDAVVAALTATIDFHAETGKDARLVSIEKIDEE